MEFIKTALPYIAIGISILLILINHKKARKSGDENKEDEGNYMCEGMCLGLCIGMTFGSEWMSLGMMIGLTIGIFIKKK